MSRPQGSALHKDAKAALPNRTATKLRFVDLSPLATKLALRVVHAWEQRQRGLRAVPPSKRPVDSLRFSIPWRDLHHQLTPSARPSRDYRHLRRAAAELFSFSCFKSYRRPVDGRGGWTAVHFLSAVDVDDGNDDASMFSFSLSPEFEEAMRILEGEGFMLIPLADAVALQDVRDLVLLMMACGAWKLIAPSMRTVPLEQVKQRLGMVGDSFASWRTTWQKLRASAQRVSARTRFRLTLTPIRAEQGDVAGIRLDVEGPGDKVRRKMPDEFDELLRRRQRKGKPNLSRHATLAGVDDPCDRFDRHMLAHASRAIRGASRAEAPEPYEAGVVFTDEWDG